MADTLLHGFTVGIRDVPQQGLLVRVGLPPSMSVLEPGQAADLGYALIAQANEAMLAEQAKRRSTR